MEKRKGFADSAIFVGKNLIHEIMDYSQISAVYQQFAKQFTIESISVPCPIFKPYSSFDKKIESKYMTNRDGTESCAYLLFDMHMVDTLAEFLEIYFNDREYSRLSTRLANRLAAEKLYVESNMHGALYFAYEYYVTEGLTYFSKDRVKKIAAYNLIQEEFTMCHELSHWCFFRCNQEEKERQLMKKRKEWGEYFAVLVSKRACKGDVNGTYLMKRMQDSILSNDRYVEECVCDTFPTIFLMENDSRCSRIDIALASFLTIQSMQMLAFVEDLIDLNQSGDIGQVAQEFSFLSTLRMLVFREYIHNFLFTNYPDEVDDFEKALIDCKEKFDQRVQAGIMEVLNVAKDKLFQLNRLDPVNIWNKNWNEMNNVIRRILLE